MGGKRKGKACIIAVSTFDNSPTLDGYKNDTRNLGDLWNGIGFDVELPYSSTGKCLRSKVGILIRKQTVYNG